jgi:hypothetical protein
MFTPTTVQEKRYVSLENLTRLSCVRSPKGTGKTELINHIANNELGEEAKALILTHRVSLSLNTQGRIGGNQYQESPEAINNSQVLHLCINSLVHLNPQDWKSIGVVVIDELEQVLNHISGDTCRRTRNQIKAKLKYVLTKAKRILVLDADLTDRGVGLVQAIAEVGPQDTELVLNTFQIPGKQYLELPDLPKVVGLAQHLLDKGERIVVLCNTKRGAEAMFKDLGGVGLLVTRDTSNKPKQREFLQAPNTHIEKYNLVVGSPSISTGISIDKEIDAVFLVAHRFDGLNDRDLRQALGRVRNPKRGYFYIEQPKHGRAPDIEAVVASATNMAIKLNAPHTIDLETGAPLLNLSAQDSAWFEYDCHQHHQHTLSVSDLKTNFVKGLAEEEGCTVILGWFDTAPAKESVKALEGLREFNRTKDTERVLEDSSSPLYQRIQGFYGHEKELTQEQVERYLEGGLETKQEQFYLTFAAPLFHLESEDKIELAFKDNTNFKQRFLVETRELRIELLGLLFGEGNSPDNQIVTETVLKGRGLGGWLKKNKTRVSKCLGINTNKESLCQFLGRVLDQLGLDFKVKQCKTRSGQTIGGVELIRGDRYYTVSGFDEALKRSQPSRWEYVPYGHQPKEYLDDEETYKNWF